MAVNGQHLTDEQHQQIRQGLANGDSPSTIAYRLNIGKRPIYAERKRMLAAALIAPQPATTEAPEPEPLDELHEDVGRLSWTQGAAMEVFSDSENRYRIGATGDWHVSSKYFRQDVLTDLYQRFSKAGIHSVFHTGNWIDGEARFNKFDLDVAGFDAQCRALVSAMPRHEGIDTYAVWGDDHEGWYAQREGINVGRYCQQVMRDASRYDWHDLGFMEAHVTLRNVNTGKTAMMAVVHPGGGSAYALSYRPQKIIEALEGGQKPSILLLGHYHKLDPGLVRNVWYCQTGCVQDQTPFMRKNSIEAHVGGVIIDIEQDPETGAIIGFNPGMLRYFDRGYYAGLRWSHHGQVPHPPRSVGGL